MFTRIKHISLLSEKIYLNYTKEYNYTNTQSVILYVSVNYC